MAVEHELAVAAIVLIKARSIPKTSSGKIQRHACRDGYVAGTLPALATWSAETGRVEIAPSVRRRREALRSHDWVEEGDLRGEWLEVRRPARDRAYQRRIGRTAEHSDRVTSAGRPLWRSPRSFTRRSARSAVSAWTS